jgi:acyl transferase domain-containing protein
METVLITSGSSFAQENVSSFQTKAIHPDPNSCTSPAAWSKIPLERFNVDAFWSPSKNRNTSITQGAHFLKDDVSKFDANFFSIPKNDVEAMDPQQRIMVEVAYEALEKAGLPLDRIAGTQTGVFMGHFTSDYKEMIYRDPDNAPLYSITGACKTSLANRISWLWDLRGPSITVDTACSSSLVALHLACQSLQIGDSDIAIVGGTSLLLNPEMFMYLSNQAFLSPDGKCKSFDESANGYGRGEGFGCVVLKRVDDAISVGDPIRAVIRGTGSNQDGHTKGFTLPSADAQAALIQETYRRAGVDMRDTGYVEAHVCLLRFERSTSLSNMSYRELALKPATFKRWWRCQGLLPDLTRLIISYL